MRRIVDRSHTLFLIAFLFLSTFVGQVFADGTVDLDGIGVSDSGDEAAASVNTGINESITSAIESSLADITAAAMESVAQVEESVIQSAYQGSNAEVEFSSQGLVESSVIQSAYQTSSDSSQKQAKIAGGEPVVEASECSSSHSWADNVCSGRKFTPIISMMLPGLAQGSGSVKESCEKAATYAKSGTALNATVLSACQYYRNSCDTACDEEIKTYSMNKDDPTAKAALDLATKNKSDCNKMQIDAITIALSLAQALQAVTSSSACSDLVDDDELFKCSQNPDAMKDPKQCPTVACNLALYPENKGNSSCSNLTQAQLAQLCQGAQAQYNPQCLSFCTMNPTACTGTGTDTAFNVDSLNKATGSGSGGFGIDGLDEEVYFDEDIKPTAGQQSPGLAKGSGGGGGGGGLGGGGGGGPGFAGDGGGGAPSSGFDTDVFRNAGGSTGGATGGSGGGGYESAGGAWKKSGSGAARSKMQNIDLSKFLPGGAKDPKRNPSSAKVQLQTMGITQANGLTNFQKVTRMINKKRPELNP